MRCLFLPFSLIVMLAASSLRAQSYTFTTEAGHPSRGSTDGTGAAAEFWFPGGTVVDSAGNLIVADTFNHTIRKVIAATGEVTTLVGVAGSPGSADGTTTARFNLPTGLAIDDEGSVFVADTGNHAIRKITAAGTVSTVAGQPSAPGAVDADGTLASFCYPQGVGLDTSRGYLYVGDTGNHTVRRIRLSTATVSTFAGLPGHLGQTEGVGSAARFNRPTGIAVSSLGTVFVADSENGIIRQIDSMGTVSTVAGQASVPGYADGFGVAARFDHPMQLAIDASDRLYVADRGNGCIRRMNGAARVSTLGGRVFSNPNAVAVDSLGNVFVADTGSHVIRKIALSGEVSLLAGRAGAGNADGLGPAAAFNTPEAMAVEATGSVIIADTGSNTLRSVALDGTVTTIAGTPGVAGSVDGPGTVRALFNRPGGVVTDSLGNRFVADTANHTIRKVGPDGVVTTVAGSPGVPGSANGTGAAARFNEPRGIAVDSAGSLFVADTLNHTIRKITAAGVVTTLAGSAGKSGFVNNASGPLARFNRPHGLVMDSQGTLFVADNGNSSIRRITPAGSVTTVAGIAGTTGSADGTTLATFNHPWGLGVDMADNVIVADFGNHSLRRVLTSSTVETIAGGAWVGLNSTQALQFPPYGGDANGAGASAMFYHPAAVCVDRLGRLYSIDRDSHTLRVGEPAATPGAPVVSQHPQSINVAPQAPATFHVIASGVGTLSYQWLKNGTPIPNQTTDTLAIAVATSGNEGTYSVVVRDGLLSTTSYGAVLRVAPAPIITTPPAALTLNDGQTAVFKVKASGMFLQYQWKKGTATIPLAVTDTLTLPNVQAGDIGSYSVVISNVGGTATTTPVTLNVLIQPRITPGTDPVDQIVEKGSSTPVTFTASVTGNPLAYQWLKNGVVMPGKTGPILTISNPQFTDAASYSLRLTNTRGTATSAAAQLVVVDRNATAVTVITGKPATLVAPVAGTVLTYQWKKAGTGVIQPDAAKYSGLGTKTLVVKTAANPADEGAYTCLITGKGGTLETGPINLAVTIPPVMASFSVPNLRVSQWLSPVVTLAAANGPVTFSVKGLPAGMVLNPKTGEISGRPLMAGSFSLSATATNAAGTSLLPATASFTVSALQDGTAGTFQGPGLVRDATLNANLAGRISVTVATNGSFTGNLIQGTTNYKLAGSLATSLSADPSATISVATARTLTLNLLPASRSLHATLTDGASATSDFDAWLPANGATFAGNYTLAALLKAADQHDDAKPQGHSFGAFQVAGTGIATGTLKLADGSSLAWSGPVGEGGNLGIFGLLYGNTGSVVAKIAIDSASGYSLSGSALDWYKAHQVATTRYFKDGFGPLKPAVVGRKYTVFPAGNVGLTFADGGAPSPATRLNITGIQLKAGSPAPVLLPAANPGFIKLGVSPGTGTAFTVGTTGGFSGDFKLTDSDTSVTPAKDLLRTATFQGMIVDDGTGQKGYGYFLLPQMPVSGGGQTPYFSGSTLLESVP